MRRTLTKGFVASMEDDENKPAPAADATEEVTAEESGDNEVADVNDGAAEGDANDAEVAEAVDAAASLEGMVDDLRAAKETGGINQQAASYMNRHLGYINKRMGISKVLPSLEAFSAPTTRLKQNVVSIETVQDTLKRIWEAIKKAIKDSIAWLEEQFNKLFGAAQKLKKRAAALAAKANGVTSAKKEQDFENERLAKALSINNQFPAKVSAELVKMHKVGEEVFGRVNEFNATKGAAVLAVLESLKLEDLKEARLAIGGVFNPVNNAEALGYAAPGDGMSLAHTAEMPGNRTVLLRGPSADVSGQGAADAIAKSMGVVTAYDSKAKGPSSPKVKTADVAEIEAIAAAVESMADAVISFKAKLGKSKDLKNQLLKASEKAEKAALSDDDKEKEAAGKALAKATHAVAKSLDSPAPQFSAYALNTSKAALEYAEASLKQYP